MTRFSCHLPLRLCSSECPTPVVGSSKIPGMYLILSKVVRSSRPSHGSLPRPIPKMLNHARSKFRRPCDSFEKGEHLASDHAARVKRGLEEGHSGCSAMSRLASLFGSLSNAQAGVSGWMSAPVSELQKSCRERSAVPLGHR